MIPHDLISEICIQAHPWPVQVRRDSNKTWKLTPARLEDSWGNQKQKIQHQQSLLLQWSNLVWYLDNQYCRYSSNRHLPIKHWLYSRLLEHSASTLSLQTQVPPLSVRIEDCNVSKIRKVEVQTYIDCNDICHCEERRHSSPNLSDKPSTLPLFGLQIIRKFSQYSNKSYMTTSFQPEDSTKRWSRKLRVERLDRIPQRNHISVQRNDSLHMDKTWIWHKFYTVSEFIESDNIRDKAGKILKERREGSTNLHHQQQRPSWSPKTLQWESLKDLACLNSLQEAADEFSKVIEAWRGPVGSWNRDDAKYRVTPESMGRRFNINTPIGTNWMIGKGV